MEQKILPNGINLILYPIDNAHSVNIGLFIKAGSRYESENDNGITHLLEHMHFRQLGKLSQNELYFNMDSIGSALKARTGKDFILFSMKISHRYFDESIGFFTDILTAINWTEEQLLAEKQVVLCELHEKGVYLNLNSVSDELIWKGHALEKPILGRQEVVENIELSDIIQLKKERFTSGNIALVITGDICDRDKENIIQILTDITFDNEVNSLPEIDDARRLQFNRKPDVVLDNCGGDILDVQIIFDIDLQKIAEHEVLFLCSAIGGGAGSVLPKKLREELGITYEIFSEVDFHEDVAIMRITLSIDKKNFYIGLSEIMETLSMMKQEIPEGIIETNMPFFTDNLWFWLEDQTELVEELGMQALRDKDVLSIESMSQHNSNINRNKLKEISKILFQPHNASISVVGSTSKLTKKKIKEIIIDYI